MLQYKMNVIEELGKKGISTYKIKKDRIIDQTVMQSLRTKRAISWASIDKLCMLLECQPSDIIEYVPDN